MKKWVVLGALGWAISGATMMSLANAQRDVRPSGSRPPPQAAGTSPSVLAQEEVDEQIRMLRGRVDEVENQLNQINLGGTADREAALKERQNLEQKFVAYEEALKKLESQVGALTEELSRLKAGAEKAPGKVSPGKVDGKKGKGPFEEGEALFGQQKFKEAILAYQKYRDAYPKGKLYAEATYKMGVSFQEMGLRDEAKVFFDEVISKFPGSKEAKRAATRAKQLK